MYTTIKTNMDEPTVVISGGGPSGLLAAILLSDNELGINVNTVVVERASEPDQWSTKSYTLVLNDKGLSSLERGRCLEAAKRVGLQKNNIYLFDGQSGEQKAIPKKPAGIGLSRPILVDCIEKEASKHQRITIKRGLGVSKVVPTSKLELDDHQSSLQVSLEDGTELAASHVIGADGKWSKVRQSLPELESQAKLQTEPSYGIHLMVSSVPDGWKTDGTYLTRPAPECKFYIIASPLPLQFGGLSVSIVCYDETIERYPWLAPPMDMKKESYGSGGWEDEYSAMPDTPVTRETASGFSSQLAALLQKEVPAFYDAIGADAAFKTARINRRVSWLDMSAPEGEEVSFTTSDGHVALIGDAAHAVTPSMGEGCNNALESAVKLADAILSEMKENESESCTSAIMSAAFAKYGTTRPKEVRPIQERSAAGSRFKKK